jgi:hypothetical protein
MGDTKPSRIGADSKGLDLIDIANASVRHEADASDRLEQSPNNLTEESAAPRRFIVVLDDNDSWAFGGRHRGIQSAHRNAVVALVAGLETSSYRNASHPTRLADIAD